MTYKEESYILDSITQMKALLEENNSMLRDLCNAVNVYLSRHQQENEDDFGRNVLANLVSNILDLGQLRRR